MNAFVGGVAGISQFDVCEAPEPTVRMEDTPQVALSVERKGCKKPGVSAFNCIGPEKGAPSPYSIEIMNSVPLFIFSLSVTKLPVLATRL